jgi:hypothetical protein
MEEQAILRTFISYSWDSDDHKAWVRFLAENMRAAGVDARLDQWHVKLGQSLAQFMETEVASADFLVVVCTPEYASLSNSREGREGYKQQIVSSQLISGIPPGKIIPLIRRGSREHGDEYAIPTLFAGIDTKDFRNDSDFQKSLEQLLWAILGRSKFVAPPIDSTPDSTSADPGSLGFQIEDASPHDREMLDFFYPCFDQAAFRIPFPAEVPRDMMRAIQATVYALDTGIRKSTDGTIIKRGRSKAEFHSQFLCSQFDKISEQLCDIITIYEWAVTTNQLHEHVRVVTARDDAIPVIIDRNRNEITKSVNDIYENLGHKAFPLIPDDKFSKYELYDQLHERYRKEHEDAQSEGDKSRLKKARYAVRTWKTGLPWIQRSRHR